MTGNLNEANQKMVDDESKRIDRKDFPTRPNRAARRRIAKQRKIFKHPGAWQYINKQYNQPEVNL